MKERLQSLGLVVLRSPALRQSALMTMGTSATGVIMAVVMILTSRALGPEPFGVFAVSIALMGVLSRGAELGLNQLMPRLLNQWHDDAEKRKAFLGQILRWKLGLSLLTILLGLGAIPWIGAILNYPHPEMIAWAVVGGVMLAVYEHVYLVLSSRHQFTWVGILGVGQALLKAVGFMTVLLFLPHSVLGVASAYYIAPFFMALLVGFRFREHIVAPLKVASESIRRLLWRYGWHAFVGTIAMTLISNLDILMVQQSLSTFDTGIYAGASRIATFVGFMTASVGGVLNNRASRYREKETLKKYLQKSLGLSAIALLGFLCFLPVARISVVLTIGPEYLPGLMALIVLVANAFLSFAVVPYISFFYAVDHPAYFSLGGILQVIVIALGNWWLLPMYGLDAAAWTRFGATLIFTLYTALYVQYALSKMK